MNKGHQDATLLAVHLRADDARRTVGDAELETLTASARVKDGEVLISLSSLDAEEPAEVTLDLRGRAIDEPTARLLTADRLQDHNTPGAPETVSPRPFESLRPTGQGLALTPPPHSFITVRMPLG